MSKRVCLDPGHGPGNVNGSADGTYLEHEFTMDLAERLGEKLEGRGVSVVLTRSPKGYPSLTERATTANRAGVDLFLSIHTNAAGASARGFMAYTSSGPENAPRNRAAVDILNAVHAAGVMLFGTGKPYHQRFTVLTDTTAPAVLLECGFHTNAADTALLKDPAYRDTLAGAICDGVCQYLGVESEDPESGEPDQPSPWAAEAWRKAVAAGIFDGTDPQGPMSREQAAVVLDRRGLI